MSGETSLSAITRRPDLSSEEKRQRLIELVVDSVASPHSRRAYRSGLEQFFRWWQESAHQEPFGRTLVQRFRLHLESRGCAPAGGRGGMDGFVTGVGSQRSAGSEGSQTSGVRTGNWLGREQAQQLLSLLDRNTLCGKCAAALLSLLLGAGLRRDELAQLRIEDLQQREGRWCLVDIEGKGKRIRTVPIPVWTKEAVDAWLQAMPFQSGLVLGKINKGGRFVGQGMTAAAIYGVVLRYEKLLQVKVKPHDLRRTLGKLAHQGGAWIEQIQLTYGHATIQTTERYLGVEQDLVDAPCVHLRLAPPK